MGESLVETGRPFRPYLSPACEDPMGLQRHDVQQRALMRHHLATAAWLPLLSPARESTPATYCPLPLHGLRWGALGKP